MRRAPGEYILVYLWGCAAPDLATCIFVQRLLFRFACGCIKKFKKCKILKNTDQLGAESQTDSLLFV